MFTLIFFKRKMVHGKEQVWKWTEEDRGGDRPDSRLQGQPGDSPVYNGRADHGVIQAHQREKCVPRSSLKPWV